MSTSVPPVVRSVKARAILCGERIDTKAIESAARLASAPLVTAVGDRGAAVLFRYGALVLVDVSPIEEVAFRRGLAPSVVEPIDPPEVEELTLAIDPSKEERIEGGLLFLHDLDLPRIQLVADVLAKSVMLARFEGGIAVVFDLVEPLAVGLQAGGVAARRSSKELLSHIGQALLIQQKMVGRAEIDDKPEVLWEHPELDRLYLRLSDEYEVRDRSRALERKLDVINRTVSTILELMQSRQALRVEWYIVALIVVELLLTVYQMITSSAPRP